MAVAVEQHTYGVGTSYSGTANFDAAITSNKIVALVCWEDTGTSSNPIASAKWNGDDCVISSEYEITIDSIRYGRALIYLDDPDQGDYDFIVTMTNALDRIYVALYEVSGADSGAPEDETSSTEGDIEDVGDFTQYMTVTDDALTLSLCVINSTNTITVKSGLTQTLDDSESHSDLSMAYGSEDGLVAGSRGHGWDWSFTPDGIMEMCSIAAEPEPNEFTAEGDLPLPTGAATFEQENQMGAAGDLPVPTGSATFENIGNPFTAAGELPMPEGSGAFEQESEFTAAGELPVLTGSGLFTNSPNDFTAAGDLPVPVGAATFEQANVMAAAGLLPMPTAAATFEFFQDPTFIEGAYAIYGLDAFGNDTVTPAIWERLDSDFDLTPGDGATAATFPTFTDDGDGVHYYEFDGVDDYLSDWPTMPDEYTVIISKSSAYPGGQPEIQSCNDTTIETMLTTPGGYTGNLHGILVFDWELHPASVERCEQLMLRRLWRDTFVDPFTGRLIRNDRCQLCMYCEEEADRFDDYSDNAIGYTDYLTVFGEGLTFPVAGAAVVMDSDAAVNLDELTIFLEAVNFDTEASAETILQNGTNYTLSIALSGSTCTITLNSSSFSFAAAGKRTLGVTVEDGAKPKFYLNGSYAGEGDANATVSAAAAGQLTIGNNTARNDPFASTLKKLSIYSEILTAAEIRAAHFMAVAERDFT